MRIRSRFEFVDLGFGPYEDLFGRVRRFHSVRANGEERDTVFFAEHAPVYTLGRRPGSIDCFFDRAQAQTGRLGGIPIIQTDRGGLATYHGPGQLMIYPVIRLRPGEAGVRRLVGALERVGGAVAARFGVDAFTRDDAPGVWTTEGKLAALGLCVRRSVTLHGMGFNVRVDAAPYARLNPCGIAGGRLANLCDLAKREIRMDEVKQAVGELWDEVWRADGPARHDFILFSCG